MSDRQELFIAVSQSEWMRWIATGRLRCNQRVVSIVRDDPATFEALMRQSPDLGDDDVSVLLAQLDRKSMSDWDITHPGAGLGSVWLPLEAVARFIPLTDRAKRLFEADAARLRVRLEDPAFEAVWSAWREQQQHATARRRSDRLRKALRLPEQMAEIHPAWVMDFLEGRREAGKPKSGGELRGSSAFAWACTFWIFFEVSGQDDKKKIDGEFAMYDTLQKMKTGYALGAPVTYSPAVPAGRQLTKLLQDRHDYRVSIPTVATILHYRHILSSDRQLNPESLLSDLAKISSMDGIEYASLAAHCIGMQMTDDMVSSLYYDANTGAFPTLTYKSSGSQLDVSARMQTLLAAEEPASDQESNADGQPEANAAPVSDSVDNPAAEVAPSPAAEPDVSGSPAPAPTELTAASAMDTPPVPRSPDPEPPSPGETGEDQERGIQDGDATIEDEGKSPRTGISPQKTCADNADVGSKDE